jgi:hypothetical protein
VENYITGTQLEERKQRETRGEISVKYKAIKARRAKWAIYSLLGIIPV